MKLLTFMERYSRRIVILAILASALCGACTMALLILINRVLEERGAASPSLVWAYAAICAMLPISRFGSELLLNTLGQSALYDLRVGLSRKILNAPLRQLEEIGAPRLLTLLTDDIPVITTALPQLPIFCINTVVVMGGLLYMGWLSPTMLVLVLGGMAIGVFAYQLSVFRAVKYFRLARETSDLLMGSFRALTQGTKELKLSRRRREDFFSRSLEASAATYQQQTLHGTAIQAAATSWGQGLLFAIIGLMIFLMARLTGADTATLTAFAMVLLFLMTPLQVMMNTVPALGRASVAIDKVESLGLSLMVETTNSGQDLRAVTGPDWKLVELVGITHTYRREGEDSHFILGPINLSLNRGQILFITGGNGSGKTTLAKLLLGLYTPESGEIRVDGKPVTDETREGYRHLFSVVLSDFFLFEHLLGMDVPNLDEEARRYLHQLQIGHKVRIVNGVLSTTELSQGQRKRLALLVAYLEDRPIFLFDEWAADQDPLFKDIFYRQLLPELKAKGKTVIAISHDDQYYGLADRIIKIDAGQVVHDVPGTMKGRSPGAEEVIAPTGWMPTVAARGDHP